MDFMAHSFSIQFSSTHRWRAQKLPHVAPGEFGDRNHRACHWKVAMATIPEEVALKKPATPGKHNLYLDAGLLWPL